MSEPRLVIRRQHPNRWLYICAGALGGALLLFALGALTGWYWNTQERITRIRYRNLMTEVQKAYLVNTELRARIAMLESSEKVARAANQELERAIAELQNQLAGVEGDLSFYQGLAGAGGGQPGLAVHQLFIAPSDTPRLFDFTLTLVQNLEDAEIVEGQIELWLEGNSSGGIRRLGLDHLLPAHRRDLRFEFKYFQVLKGNLIIPPEFEPEQITVRLVPAGDENVTVLADFAWSTVLKRASLNPIERENRGAKQS